MSIDREFFRQKIETLSDDELRDLLHKTGNGLSPEIYQIAKEEASARNLAYHLNAIIHPIENLNEHASKEKLNKWNWGAFLLAPFWTLANRLEAWTILCFIPFVNIGVIIYLGYNGNRMAYEKNNIKSINDFLRVQAEWGRQAVKLLWLLLLGGIIAFTFNLIRTWDDI